MINWMKTFIFNLQINNLVLGFELYTLDLKSKFSS